MLRVTGDADGLRYLPITFFVAGFPLSIPPATFKSNPPFRFIMRQSMPWYKISFPRAEASDRIGNLAQDFLDTLQAAEFRDGIALFKERTTEIGGPIVYYLSLNTLRPSRRLTDTYRATPCQPPDPEKVDHFGGDESILNLR
jgi:hypothetical protein